MLLDQLKAAAEGLRKMAESLPEDPAPVEVIADPEPVVTKVAMPQADSRQIMNFMKFFIKA
jgi:hypothetical protein